MKKLYLTQKDRKILGVCGSIGETYDIDPTIVRLITFFMLINRDFAFAYHLLHSMDNHAESIQSLREIQQYHSGLKAETEDGQTKPGQSE